jgi:hypothetical protein
VEAVQEAAVKEEAGGFSGGALNGIGVALAGALAGFLFLQKGNSEVRRTAAALPWPAAPMLRFAGSLLPLEGDADMACCCLTALLCCC